MSEAVNKENTETKRVGSYQQPFVEKYRPRTLDDVEGNEETILRLRAIGKDGNMPNLILAGPPGTGSKWMHDDGCAISGAVVEVFDSRSHGIDRVSNLVRIPSETTSVHALARHLLGPAYKQGVLELNASDARGIDVVRNRIKSFAMNKVTLPPGR